MRRQWKRGYFDYSHLNHMSVSGDENQSVFINFYRFIKLSAIQSYIQYQYRLDHSIALNYIKLQINLGMKVITLSHSVSSLYTYEIYK